MSTTTAQTIETLVFKSLEDFGADAGAISRAATFEAIDVDSLDLAELAQIVDDEYGVTVSSKDMENLETVGDVIDLIASRTS